MLKKWFKAAGTRALKTIAEAAVATIGTSFALGDVNWSLVISASILAGILSMLISIKGLPEAPGIGQFANLTFEEKSEE